MASIAPGGLIVAPMQAWFLDESPGTYRQGDVDTPAVGADDVRIKVVASALNHMDLWLTRGAPKPRTLPHVPGCDVAGTVEEVGAAVIGIAIGDEVVVNPAVSPVADIIEFGTDSPMGPGFMIYGEHRWGGHAEFAVVPARNVVRRPDRPWVECAAFPLAYLTAYRMLRRARVSAGDTVLVVGIGSGVSCAALAIARQMGARVIVTSRSEAKRAESLGMGAVAAYDSAAPKWPVQADVVVESVGPATWDQSVRALKPGGRMVVCGSTSGSTVELNLTRLFFQQVEIIGSTMGSYEEFADLVRLVDHGLPIRVDRVFDIEEYPAALARLESGRQLGKIVLRHRL